MEVQHTILDVMYSISKKYKNTEYRINEIRLVKQENMMLLSTSVNQ
jgi:hypothetical protein